MSRKVPVRIVIAVLLALTTASILYKVIALDYTFVNIIPQKAYHVEISMQFTGNGDDLVVRTFLPATDERQNVSGEISEAPGLNFSRESTPLFLRGEWIRPEASGVYRIRHSFDVVVKPVVYEIPEELRIPDTYPQGLEQHLKPTDVIQINHPAINEIARRILPSDRSTASTLTAIYDYVLALGERPFKGTTDAVTAAKLGAASCNGKSRLFIALARRAGIPSRLVGGIILNPGAKRTSHQWVEAWINGHWVPFDGLNGRFASLPDNYLALYRGDEALFVHSRNIGFDYRFNIRKTAAANNRISGFLAGHGLNLYRTLLSFGHVDIPLNVLQFLLVIPLGVVVVVLSRNVFGMRTLGTFLPALMAMAARDTGITAGLTAFVVVLGVGLLVRWPLDRLGILHTPKLAILMIVVVFTLIGLTVVADLFRIESASRPGAVSLFPIAILTITTERIALMLTEDGPRKTLSTILQTLVVTAVCYAVISSLALQALMIAFPELLLSVTAFNLWIGTWTGLRVSEMIRFRELWTRREEPNNV